jgi:AcrR family transcriptional regulator
MTSRRPEATGVGLRDRKKERTRSRLLDVALSLFEEKGFDATTVEEIAAAAEVAPRTLFRYFTSKEDLVLLGQDAENRQIAERLRLRPPQQSPLDFLLETTHLLLHAGPEEFERARRSQRLIRATPSLRDRQRGLVAELEEMLSAGLTPSRATQAEALRIRVVVAVFLAAATTVLHARMLDEIRGDPREQLDKVMQMLRMGFG